MDSESTSITLVRSFDAPIGRVFSAWTEAELIRRWLAPRFCSVRDVETRPFAGGTFRIGVEDAYGTYHLTTGEYVRVVPNRLVECTWAYQGPEAVVADEPTRLRIDFYETPAGAGTEITLRHEELRPETDTARLRRGWSECLDKLEELLDELAR